MNKKLLTYLVIPLLVPIMIVSCSKKKEEAPKVEKVKKYVPEYKVITEEKLEQWLKATERVGEFIKKYSLGNEEVTTKDHFMMIAHSSDRTEMALKELWKEAGLKPGEFWFILDRLQDTKRYSEIKLDEADQNRKIDILLKAGREERADLEKSLMVEKREAERAEIERRLGIVREKFTELSSLKGNILAEKVGLEQANIDLWLKNRERIEAALKKMWKVIPGREKEMPRDKSIPGH